MSRSFERAWIGCVNATSAELSLMKRREVLLAAAVAALAACSDPAPSEPVDAGGVVTSAKIYLGAVASSPLFASASEPLLVGQKLSESSIAAAASQALKYATPMDNTDFLTNWRKTMVERYVDGALREVAGIKPKGMAPQHGLWVA